jgi:ribosomal protein S27E
VCIASTEEIEEYLYDKGWLNRIVVKCPSCKSEKVIFCPGGTVYSGHDENSENIKWICENCLTEW